MKISNINKIAVGALCAAAALPAAFADFTSPKATGAGGELRSRTDISRTATKSLTQAAAAKADGMMRAPRREALTPTVAPETYGELVEVMYEDFQGMALGSFGEPDETNLMKPSAERENAWETMRGGYCHLDGWGADEGTLSAGGMVCLDALGGQSHINTPMLDVSASKLSALEFRVFCPETESQTVLCVEAAETFDMSPTWDILEGYMIDIPQGEWHDVRVVFSGGQASTLYNIVLMTQDTQAYIDDVRVSTITTHVGIPDIKAHAEYAGTSFKARWTPVEGADKYLVNVYERAYGGGLGDTVHEDLEATEAELTLTELESGVPYWVEVRAVKGEHVGFPSVPRMVWDVEAPELGDVDAISDWKYTATWGEVPNGDVYNYWAYGKRVADKDGKFTITKAKYDQLTDHDGNRMEWTHEENEGKTYDEYNVQGGIDQEGWRGKHCAPFKDYLCIDGWWYITAHEDAGLLSPEMDLSANGGKATLKMRLASEFLPADYNEYGIDLQVQCAVAVFAWDDAKEDYSQVMIKYPGEVSLRWTDFTVELEGLTDRCVIGIYAVSAPGNLYISDLLLTQERKEGEAFMDPFCFRRWHGEQSLEVAVKPYVSGTEVYHRVGATAGIVESNGWDNVLISQDGAFGPLKYVGSTEWTDSVSEIELEEGSVRVADGRVTVSNPAGATVAVYNAEGICLVKSAAAEVACSLPASGLYFVKVGKQTTKICR